MTPDPKGFPRKSPLYQCVPSKPLTDKRIEQLCLDGWYGTSRQHYYTALANGKKILSQQKKQQQKKIQQQIDDLTK